MHWHMKISLKLIFETNLFNWKFYIKIIQKYRKIHWKYKVSTIFWTKVKNGLIDISHRTHNCYDMIRYYDFCKQNYQYHRTYICISFTRKCVEISNLDMFGSNWIRFSIMLLVFIYNNQIYCSHTFSFLIITYVLLTKYIKLQTNKWLL